jgi:selenide,water dikinase
MAHPDLIVGTSTSDDAGVYRLSDERALVQTVDFFTPVVDDPYDWGRIAAANALSDVYAMGGTPMTALQVVGWPRDVIPYDVLHRVLLGGADVMEDAECTIVGGHTIDDPEPKYGFAVTGVVDTGSVVTNGAASPGQHLVLTKPIGTGIIATAIKRNECPDDVARQAIESMAALNRAAAKVMVGAGVRAATDVTGFGLLGHLGEIADASAIGIEIDVDAVPVLPGSRELLAGGCFPGGSERNVANVAPRLSGRSDEEDIRLLCDAQTSGGLVICVDAGEVEAVLELPGATVIGRTTGGPPGTIRLV